MLAHKTVYRFNWEKSSINICRVLRKLFEHEAADLTHVNAVKQTYVIAILACWYDSIEKYNRKCLEIT